MSVSCLPTNRQSGFVIAPLQRTNPCCGTDSKTQLTHSPSFARDHGRGGSRLTVLVYRILSPFVWKPRPTAHAGDPSVTPRPFKSTSDLTPLDKQALAARIPAAEDIQARSVLRL